MANERRLRYLFRPVDFGRGQAVSAERQTPKLKVFISYSRQDMAFVDRLEAVLADSGVETFVDRTAIAKGEEWWDRIRQLITEADTIVFVLSPGSVDSTICNDEVKFAEKLNKRFVPIVARDLEERTVPATLARLNYIFFIPHPAASASGDFDAAVRDLVQTLETDILWIREHTRLGALAERWQAQQRPSDLLLRGAELNAAETWLTMRPQKAPNPTEAHHALITLSRQAATQRQRAVVGVSLAAAVVCLTLAGVAMWQRSIALKNEAQADHERNQALAIQSRFLADLARQSTAQGQAGTAVLFALEALPDIVAGVDRPHAVEAEFELDRALRVFSEPTVLVGYPTTAQVTSAAFSPDGARAVVASNSNNYTVNTVQLWDAVTGNEVARLEGHKDRINSVAFSSDGMRVVTASADKTARVWDAVKGKEIARLEGHSAKISRAALSPDGARVVTAEDGIWANSVRVWNAVTGEELARLEGHTHGVTSVKFSSDGRVMTASGNGARLWDAGTGKQLISLDGHMGIVNSAAFSPDGSRVVTASSDNTARVWDAGTGKEITRLNGHTDIVKSAAFSPDGVLVLTVSRDKTARVWHAATGFQLNLIGGKPLTHWVANAAFSADGARVVTSSGRGYRVWDAEDSGKVPIDLAYGEPGNFEERDEKTAFSFDGSQLMTGAEIWTVATPQELIRFKGHMGSVNSATFSLDGSRVVTTSSDNTARVWDAGTGKEIALFPGLNAAFGPDGTRVVVSEGKLVRVWDASTGKEIARLEGHTDRVTSATFSPDGTRVVTASQDRTARVWGAATGKEIARLEGHCPGPPWMYVSEGCAVTSAAFRPDGARVVTASNDDTARVWDAETGKELVQLKPYCGTLGCSVMSAAFSPDGRRVVVFEGKAVRVWDAATGKELERQAHNPGSGAARRYFSDAPRRNGTRVVTSEYDMARVWDLSTGGELARLKHSGHVHSAAFSPDGARVVTASGDKTARIWRVYRSTDELVQAAKSRMRRCLTREQRRDHFLPEVPPLWCVERRLGPYHTDAWQTWLIEQRAWLASSRQRAAPPLPAK
jgi:WD40 repeat protein